MDVSVNAAVWFTAWLSSAVKCFTVVIYGNLMFLELNVLCSSPGLTWLEK